MTELNDELLVAYADGQLARDQSRAVERVLANDAFAAQRVADLRLAHVRLGTAFESMLLGEQAEMGLGKPPGMEDAEPPPPARAANANDASARRPPKPPSPLLSDASLRMRDWADTARRHATRMRDLSQLRFGSLKARAERRAESGAASAGVAIERLRSAMQGWPMPSRDRAGLILDRATVFLGGRHFWLGGAAALVSFIVVGTVFVLIVQSYEATQPPAADPLTTAALPKGDWREEAARAQSLLSRETFEIGLDSQGNLDLVAFQLSKTFGTDLAIPDLTSQGLAFKRAQLLRHQGRPVAQIAYLGDEGAPLILYITAENGETMPDFRQVGALGSATWTEDGFSYLIVGPGGRMQMLRLIDAVRGAKPAAPE